MSQRIGDIVFIYEEAPQECDDCGKIDELRPYGPNGSMVCYDCAMKDPHNCEIQTQMKLFGETLEEATRIADLKYGRKS